MRVAADGFAAVSPVPEPGTYALMLAGVALVGGAAARRRARGALSAQDTCWVQNKIKLAIQKRRTFRSMLCLYMRQAQLGGDGV